MVVGAGRQAGRAWTLGAVLTASALVWAGTSPECARADGAKPLAIAFDAASQTLVLILPPGVSPAIFELTDPPRLVVNLPGAMLMGARREFYPNGGVSQLEFTGNQAEPRVVLYLRERLRGAWRVDWVGDRLAIRLPEQATSWGASPAVPVASRTPRPQATPGWPVTSLVPVPPSLAITSPPLPPAPVASITEPPTPLLPEADAPGIFGSRWYLGSDLPLTFTENYPLGASELAVELLPGGVFGWEQMLARNFGLCFGGRASSYTSEDAMATGVDVSARHRRDEYEGTFAIRGRMPLVFGLEGLVQPGLTIKRVQVDNTVTGLNAGGEAAPASGSASTYGASGWLGYGGVVTGGLGWRVAGPFSLVATGEWTTLFAGSMDQVAVTSIIPLSGYRLAGEARLEWGALGVSAGYMLGHFGHVGENPDDVLDQNWHGPTLKATWSY